MLPYADLPYFVFALLLAVPGVVLGALGRSRRGWILATAAIAAVVHFAPVRTAGPVVVNVLLVAVGYAAYQLALMLAFARRRRHGRSVRVFAAVLVLSLVPLVLVKLRPFLPGVWGFVGISYVTFRAVDVLIGIHDGLIEDVPPSNYLAFLFFFPTLSAGPIDRYRRFVQDFRATPSRQAFLQGVDHGVDRLFHGLFYKFVVAAAIRHFWLDPTATGWLGITSYAYAYSLYLFFDFAGYSAIAVGVSRFFGIRTPENFDRPFLAANIADFWNRWHISLSTWFRDHVYMRFSMAATRGRWFPNRNLGSYLGFLLTFGLMGAWHGLQGHYLLYGLFHAALMIGHSIVARTVRRRWPTLARSRAWRVAGIVTTFNAVCLSFLIFSGRLR